MSPALASTALSTSSSAAAFAASRSFLNLFCFGDSLQAFNNPFHSILAQLPHHHSSDTHKHSHNQKLILFQPLESLHLRSLQPLWMAESSLPKSGMQGTGSSSVGLELLLQVILENSTKPKAPIDEPFHAS